MAVHLQIAEQVNKHIDAQNRFKRLEAFREEAIEEAIKDAKEARTVSTAKINAITEEMNAIAKAFQFPTRKLVTPEMVLEYVKK
ncbi:DUF2533 family protein [Bacillus alkalicellulosilyticus]|uniref:DUF2533 family protein n=1 Tax=Alkalihalobacterium alkalicellulosilyticum TaxID=1912214 RepID=UPI000998E07B|nr:DUF2533 family protein [Bacillus alkalicellulosilyticus]